MKNFYQVVNSAFQEVPVVPFEAYDLAVEHIRSLQETYTDQTFHIVTLIVNTISPRARA